MTSDSKDPFQRIAAGSAGTEPTAPHPPADGELIAPVPPDAPLLPSSWRGLGSPSAAWAYRTAAGAVLRWTLRFDRQGEKTIRPATLRQFEPDGSYRWIPKAEPGPRPLYGLDRLASRPADLVVVVEGEKTADAAAVLFSELVVVTWPGGAEAVRKVDFSPLQGRRVVIWPDADQPGSKAALAVMKAALAAGADLAAVVSLPPDLPKGWDLADPWPAGLDLALARRLIAEAEAEAEPVAADWPMGLRMEPSLGLFYDEPRDGGVIPHWLSDPFEVLGEGRSPDGAGWAVVIRFRDRDGRERTVPIPRATLASGGGDARAALADLGLIFDTTRGKGDRFASALMRVKSSRRITLVTATGWCGDRFVLPGRTIGPAGGEPVLFTADSPSLHYRVAGRFEAWREDLARLALGNAALSFAISAALAAPLLRLLGAEGGGFHFRGNSSTGKSTLLIAAGSVWGGSAGEQGYGHTWRTTGNATETLALAHNDTLLCLDEIAQVDPAEAGVVAYALANGQGKARLKADGSLRKRAEWLTLFLSSGEISLADHMASSAKGGRAAAGQELRMIDLPAEAGAGMGIWERLHGAAGPAQLSEAVKSVARGHYGHAGPMFLERLTAQRAEAVEHARDIVKAFLANAEQTGDSGQARRAGRRFAVAAAAGELAIAWGIVPWPAGAAAEAALALYHRWAEGFGRDSPREERSVLKRLRAVIESERAAFAPIGDADEEAAPSPGGRDGEARSQKTHGYRRVRGSEVHYLFSNAGWAYVFQGFDLKEAAKTIHRHGFLEVGNDKKRLQKKTTIRGETPWLYVVKAEILTADLGD